MITADVRVNIEKDFFQRFQSSDLIAKFFDEILLRLLVVLRLIEEKAFFDRRFVANFDQFFTRFRVAFSSVRKKIHVSTFLL